MHVPRLFGDDCRGDEREGHFQLWSLHGQGGSSEGPGVDPLLQPDPDLGQDLVPGDEVTGVCQLPRLQGAQPRASPAMQGSVWRRGDRVGGLRPFKERQDPEP